MSIPIKKLSWYLDGGSAASEMPLSQSDTFAWYKASMVDQSDSIYEYESSLVKGLDDLSGHRRDMYINTDSFKPALTTLSGKAAIAMTGTGGTTGSRFCFPFRPKQLFNISGGFEIIIATTIPDGQPATNDRRFWQHDGTSPSNDFFSGTLLQNGRLNVRLTQGGATVNAQTSSAVYTDGDNGLQYLRFRFDLVNEQTSIITANTSSTWQTRTITGASFSALNMADYGENFLNMVFFARQITSDNFTPQSSFKELIITNKLLSAQEATDIYDYLQEDPQTVVRYNPTGSPNTPASTNKLRIILGQSQYDGRVTPLDTVTYPYLADPIPRSYTFDWKLFNVFAPLEAGVNGCNADTKMAGPIFPLANRLQNDNPGNTYFFQQNCFRGTSLAEWSVGGFYYNNALFNYRNIVNTLFNSVAGVNIENTIFFQGESDCQPGDEADSLSYQAREAITLVDYRTAFPADRLTSLNLHNGYILANFPYFQNIIDAKDDNAALVDELIPTIGFGLLADSLHYNMVGCESIAAATN